MPRIAASQVHAQIASVIADELRVASPNDPRISRTDQKSLAPDVQRAVDDVRATKPGGHVTFHEAHGNYMDRVAASIDAVNQQGGTGRAWLSKAEIEALKQRDPVVGERAQKAYQLLATGAPVATFDPVKWQADMAGAMSFQFEALNSEGARPMSPVRVPGPHAAVDAASVKAAFGHASAAPENTLIRELDGATVAADLSVSFDAPGYSTQQKADGRKIIALLGQLRDVKAFVIGDTATMRLFPTYIVGLAPDGSLMGLKTELVRT